MMLNISNFDTFDMYSPFYAAKFISMYRIANERPTWINISITAYPVKIYNRYITFDGFGHPPSWLPLEETLLKIFRDKPVKTERVPFFASTEIEVKIFKSVSILKLYSLDPTAVPKAMLSEANHFLSLDSTVEFINSHPDEALTIFEEAQVLEK